MSALEEIVIYTETRYRQGDEGADYLEISATQLEGDGFTARLNVPLTEDGIEAAFQWGSSIGELLARVFTEAMGGVQ